VISFWRKRVLRNFTGPFTFFPIPPQDPHFVKRFPSFLFFGGEDFNRLGFLQHPAFIIFFADKKGFAP
jgi:hypothetical protein